MWGYSVVRDGITTATTTTLTIDSIEKIKIAFHLEERPEGFILQLMKILMLPFHNGALLKAL